MLIRSPYCNRKAFQLKPEPPDLALAGLAAAVAPGLAPGLAPVIAPAFSLAIVVGPWVRQAWASRRGAGRRGLFTSGFAFRIWSAGIHPHFVMFGSWGERRQGRK